MYIGSGFREHDNVDRDVIIVNKDSLLLRLRGCKEFFSSTTAGFGYAGMAITLLSSAVLTENFRSIGAIPGETIRTTFIVLGITTTVLAGRCALRWLQNHKFNEPETIVEGLTQKKFNRPERNRRKGVSTFFTDDRPLVRVRQQKKDKSDAS